MIRLEDDLSNPYDDPKITDKRMDVYVDVVVTGLTAADDDGIYTDVIAEVVAAYDPFHLNVNKLVTDFSIGIGKTELRGNVIAEFKEFASDNMGMVKRKYFKTSHDKYVEFYTYGMEDFNAMNKSTAPGLLQRYATAAHKYVADFTVGFDNEAASFVTRYASAKSVQDIAKFNIGADRTGRDTGRTAVNIAVYGAYNFAKYKSNCNYDFMHAIFPIETLYRHTRHDIKHLDGLVDALATVNAAEDIYDGTYWLLLHNIGPTDLRVGLELTATTEVGTAKGKIVRKGMNKSFKIITTGDPTNHFLNITNLNLKEGGSWKMDIYQED